MKKWLILGALSMSSLLQADCDYSLGSTNNYMIPVGRVILSPETEEGCFAYSLLAEGGVRTWRANGTVGGWTTEQSRLKVSAEFLSQKLSYGFSSGKEYRWMNQGAVGAEWEYLFDDCNFVKALNFDGYYSYAPSRDLGTKQCGIVGGPTTPFIRNIGGSNAYGGSVGLVTLFSECFRFDASLDYDHVRYRRKYSDDKTVSGLGGSFKWTARLPCCMDFTFEGQFRRPFNYFGARLTAPQLSGVDNLNIAFFGGVTRGKYRLPNNTTAGIEVVYNFTTGCCPSQRSDCRPLWNPCDLSSWVQTPAVYMPEVLAIAEECRSFNVNPFPLAFLIDFGDSYNIISSDIMGVAPGPDVVFSATGLPDSASFDPTNGAITGQNFVAPGLTEVYNVTVTVTRGCASQTGSFELVLFPPPF